MGWQSWNLKDSVAIQTVTAIEGAISPVITTMESILNIVKTIVEFVKALIVDIPDLETVALKAAIETIRALLKDLTGDAGCYFLPIPVRLKNVVADETLIFDPTPGGAEQADATNLFLPPVGGGAAGNYGFMKDVMDSLGDTNDIMRPQFDQDAHVAGFVVLAGADSYLDILPLIEKLKRWLSGKKKSGAGEGMANPDYPECRGLKAEIVPSVIGQLQKIQNRKEGGGSTHPYAVKLSWDLPERITVLRQGSWRYTLTVDKVVVFRSETKFSKYTNPDTLRSEYKLKEFDFDGLLSVFYDDSIELGKTYYYGVGYNMNAKAEFDGELSRETSYLATADVVTSIDIPVEINMLPRSGIPPDWMLFPNPLALIPDLVEVVNNINAFLDSLEKRIDTKSKKFEEYINALSAEIERYSSLATGIIGTIKDIIDLLTFPDVYIGAFPFAGKGGNAFFTNELSRSLQDTSDPSRPPFDRGDEVVTGFIMYAGSATVGKLQAFQTFIEMLVGQTVGGIEQNYAEAMVSIGYAVDEIERQICLLKNLEKGVCPDEEAALPGMGPDLEPSEEADGCNT
jgi:hypothetical protein